MNKLLLLLFIIIIIIIIIISRVMQIRFTSKVF